MVETSQQFTNSEIHVEIIHVEDYIETENKYLICHSKKNIQRWLHYRERGGLGLVFTWKTSPQGYYYWRDIDCVRKEINDEGLSYLRFLLNSKISPPPPAGQHDFRQYK